MKKFYRNFWIICAVLSLLFACGKPPAQQEYVLPQDLPDQQIDSVRIITTNNNHIEQIITAVHIDQFTDKKLTLADTVLVKNLAADSTVTSTLYCDEAEIDDTRNFMIAKGNVVVNSDNGKLLTPYLVWNRNTDEVFAQNGVTLIREKNTLRGSELKTDINLDKIKIFKVSAEGKLDEQQTEDLDW
jgi:LPS export ABC transporter protein LptC